MAVWLADLAAMQSFSAYDKKTRCVSKKSFYLPLSSFLFLFCSRMMVFIIAIICYLLTRVSARKSAICNRRALNIIKLTIRFM